MRPHSGETKIFALAVHWQTIMGSASESECHRIVIRSNDNSQHHAALHSADCSLHKENVLGLFSNSHCSEYIICSQLQILFKNYLNMQINLCGTFFLWIGKKERLFFYIKFSHNYTTSPFRYLFFISILYQLSSSVTGACHFVM